MSELEFQLIEVGLLKKILAQILQNQGAIMLRLSNMPDRAGPMIRDMDLSSLQGCCERSGALMAELQKDGEAI